MTESEPRLAPRAQAVLEEAGHEALSCTDQRGSFPCRGVAGGDCPLDGGVEVAVSAPGSVPPDPQAGDVGLICAMRHRLPVVVAAPDDVAWPGSRFGLVAIDDLVAEVERVASAPLPDHTEAALGPARRLIGDSVRASVTRHGNDLLVVLDLPAGTDEHLAQSVAVLAQGAVRRLDLSAAGIDVRLGPV